MLLKCIDLFPCWVIGNLIHTNNKI
jgi:hypothetical protein